MFDAGLSLLNGFFQPRPAVPAVAEGLARGASPSPEHASGSPFEPRGRSDPAFLLEGRLKEKGGQARGLPGRPPPPDRGALELGEKLRAGFADADAFRDGVEAALAAAGRDLDRLFQMLGFGEKERGRALAGFAERFGQPPPTPAGGDRGAMPVPPQNPRGGPAAGAAIAHARTDSAFALQVTNIELSIETGGKSISVRFEQASLAVASRQETLLAGLDGTGGGSLAAARAESSLAAHSLSLSVEASGLTAAEMKALDEGLSAFFDKAARNGGFGGEALFGGAGLEGAARLRPNGQASPAQQDGLKRFLLDLAVPIGPGGPGGPGEPPPEPVRITV